MILYEFGGIFPEKEKNIVFSTNELLQTRIFAMNRCKIRKFYKIQLKT